MKIPWELLYFLSYFSFKCKVFNNLTTLQSEFYHKVNFRLINLHRCEGYICTITFKHMFRLFEPRSTLDRLREKYSFLMRQAYELAVIDKSRSDLLNDKACKILQEIHRMEYLQEERSSD